MSSFHGVAEDMTQEMLNQQIAAATGEDPRLIARRGFIPLSHVPFEQDEENYHEPSIIDWDEVELERHLALTG